MFLELMLCKQLIHGLFWLMNGFLYEDNLLKLCRRLFRRLLSTEAALIVADDLRFDGDRVELLVGVELAVLFLVGVLGDEPRPLSLLILRRFLVVTPGLVGDDDSFALFDGVFGPFGDFCRSLSIEMISIELELLLGLLIGDFLVAKIIGSILLVTILYLLSLLPRRLITSSSMLVKCEDETELPESMLA